MPYTSSTENYAISTRDSPSRWSGKDGKNYVYKKSSYQYSSNNNNNNNNNIGKFNTNIDSKYKSSNQNIEQLDALLEDLKNERQMSTRETELPSNGYRTIETEHVDPTTGAYTKTTRSIKTSQQHSTPKSYADEVDFSTSDYSSTLKSSNYSSFQDSLKRDDYQRSEKSYGLGASSLVGGAHYAEQKTRAYESNRALNSTEIVPTTVGNVDPTPDIQKELQNIALSEDILPVPGTKVTTTVRTYTYEIPAGGVGGLPTTAATTNSSYNTLKQHETSSSVLQGSTPASGPPPGMTTYNAETYSTINRGKEVPIIANQSYEYREHKESTTSKNSTLQRHAAPTTPLPSHTRTVPINTPAAPLPNNNSSTVVYNVHKSDNVSHVTADGPASPTPYAPGTPLLGGGTTKHYFYKETSNVVNTIHGPPKHSSDGRLPPSVLAPAIQPELVYPPSPQPASSYSYKYSSSTLNNRRQEQSPSLPPAPFPIDGVVERANPPQRVDDLMQSFGNGDAVDRADVDGLRRKREIDTSIATPNQQHVPSVNRPGKEVYYPPGHESMLLKREEMAAGSAAGGRWAKGSGMYEYEAGEKSKSKSKSGGAMVPVCLPLCCAMPCTIM